MRVLGALLLALGVIALIWSVRELDRQSRPKDVAAALAAPIAAAVALLGLALIFVPGFL